MSGQWEAFVERAARSLHQERFGADVPWHTLSSSMQQSWIFEARAVLTTVAPLIAEDTRTRMVEAAAAAVKREGGGSEREKVAEEVIARLVARRAEITPGRPGWVYFTEAIDMVNEVCGVKEAS